MLWLEKEETIALRRRANFESGGLWRFFFFYFSLLVGVFSFIFSYLLLFFSFPFLLLRRDGLNVFFLFKGERNCKFLGDYFLFMQRGENVYIFLREGELVLIFFSFSKEMRNCKILF